MQECGLPLDLSSLDRPRGEVRGRTPFATRRLRPARRLRSVRGRGQHGGWVLSLSLSLSLSHAFSANARNVIVADFPPLEFLFFIFPRITPS